MIDDRTGWPGARRAGRGVTATATLMLLVIVALIAAGCGESSPDTQASEAYANSVCSAIGSWEQQVKSIATDLSGGISKASLQTKITEVESATKTLATEIKAIPPPDTSEGQAAQQQLDQLSTSASTTVASAKSAVAEIPSDASPAAVAAALAPLAPQVTSLASKAQSTINSLEEAGGSLASAFKSADSCKSLGG
jgi:hypothetical protein